MCVDLYSDFSTRLFLFSLSFSYLKHEFFEQVLCLLLWLEFKLINFSAFVLQFAVRVQFIYHKSPHDEIDPSRRLEASTVADTVGH